MKTNVVKATAGHAARSDFLDKLGRVGFIVDGVIHLLIGVIAFELARGGGGGQASQSGAMASLAESGFGQALLWAGAAGFAALAVWCVIDAVLGSRGTGGSRKLGETAKYLGKAILFVVFATLAVRFALGSGGGGGAESATATLLGVSGGGIIIGMIGVAIAIVGLYHIYKGVSRKFLEDLRGGASIGSIGTAIVALGVVGYAAKGVAIGVAGILFVVAALQHDPDKAGDLDDALKTLQNQAYGPWLLTIVAIGIAAFGVYLFGRARYQRM